MDAWKEIWNSRKTTAQGESLLQYLLALDGFDSGAGKIDETNWRDYVECVFRKIELNRIGQHFSIYEVGCGAGAFLYPFFEKGHIVGGIDYSTILINNARNIFGIMNFNIGEANDIDIEKNTILFVLTACFIIFLMKIMQKLWSKK